tara:strand:- start:1399 stop:3363 length:1965 start_codon:yes stop_codon:yes gene_type:complete
MATKKVNIDLVAKDKTRQAMQSATKGVDGVKSSVLNLKNALIGLGAGVAIKGFVDVGKSVESLQVRLKFLFGSVEEGSRAFDAMAKFASKVPFSLGEIQSGAGVLAVVSKDANELSKVLELTGNVAAVTGLDFRTTAEQIQRSLSAGISSADLFREKGVKSMLGFSAGATVSVEQTREALFRVFGKDGEFAGATDDLANTLEGTLSMIGDKFFNFQKTVAEKFFVALKKEFGSLDEALAANEGLILDIADSIGKGLGTAVTIAADAVRVLADNIEILKKAGIAVLVFGMTKAFISLSIAIKKASIAMLSFTKMSMKNLAGLLAAGAVLLADYTGMLDKLFESLKAPKTLEDLALEVEILNDQIGLLEEKDFTENSAFRRMQDEAHRTIDALKKMQIEVGEDTAEFVRLEGMIESIREALMSVPLQEITFGLDEQAESVGFLTESFGKFKEGFMEAMNKDTIDGFVKAGKTAFDSLKQTLTDFVVTGELNMKKFADVVKRAIIEALIGKAVQAAVNKAMAMFKMDAIKKALISVYEGALRTFASIPFPFNIAAVGGAIAFGMGMVNKIKGFERGGRPPVGQPSIVGEKGAELFVPDQAGTIVPNNQLGMSRPVTVNFNINTVDARGFNELLVNSRGVIVSMINTAVNEKGKEALI